jgi:hypothetical protein
MAGLVPIIEFKGFRTPQHTARNLFCNFCNSIRHDEKECPTFDLMRECTTDAYRVQGEEGWEGGVL